MYTIFFYVLTDGGIEAKPLGRPRVLLLFRRDISVFYCLKKKQIHVYFFLTDGRINAELKGRVRGLLYIDGAYLCFIVMI